jgi:hypothetical protein
MPSALSDSATHNPQSTTHWPSVWQFGLSLFSILALWGLSAMMLLAVFSSAIAGDTLGTLAVLLNTAGMAFAGVLLIPSAGYALLRLVGKSATFRFHLRHPSWVIIALPPVILLGHLVSQVDLAAYFLLPIFHVSAAAISVGWLLALGLRGLSFGSPQLSWGVFSCGLVGAPILSLITELIVLLVIILFGLVYLMQEPQVLEALLELSQTMPENASETAFELLQPYVMKPGILYIALLFSALLVPLLEEFFKPIGVWLLVRRQPTPAQGFAAGLLSGAGYALFENFLLGASAGSDWAVVVIARLGTSLIHVLTTGLMGWALVLAWRERHYLRLAATYFVAVAIHGIWNGTVILTAVSELFTDEVIIPDFLVTLGQAAPIIFTILIVLCLLLLLGFNIALGRGIPQGDDIIPPALLQPIMDTNPERENKIDGNYHEPN